MAFNVFCFAKASIILCTIFFIRGQIRFTCMNSDPFNKRMLLECGHANYRELPSATWTPCKERAHADHSEKIGENQDLIFSSEVIVLMVVSRGTHWHHNSDQSCWHLFGDWLLEVKSLSACENWGGKMAYQGLRRAVLNFDYLHTNSWVSTTILPGILQIPLSVHLCAKVNINHTRLKRIWNENCYTWKYGILRFEYNCGEEVESLVCVSRRVCDVYPVQCDRLGMRDRNTT